MKIYKKGVDLFLINGDIYLTDPSISNGFNTHSTKEHPGTKLLDRTKFIKPVDIMELYNKAKYLDSIKRIFFSNYTKLSLPELINLNENDKIVEVGW